MVDGRFLRGILVRNDVVSIPVCPCSSVRLKVGITEENERFVSVSLIDNRPFPMSPTDPAV